MKYYVSRLSVNRGQMQASTYNTSREDPGSDRSSVPSLVVKSDYIRGILQMRPQKARPCVTAGVTQDLYSSLKAAEGSIFLHFPFCHQLWC